MAGDTRELAIRITGNASDAQRALGQLGDSADKTNKKFGALGGGLGKMAGLAAGALAGIGLGEFLGNAVSDLKNVERINAQTEQVIKSMGNQAGVSADYVGKLAEDIEKLTTIEMEGVQEGANLLLTFGNIKNAAGEGNDVFDQTVGIMADMSKALGTDAKGSAIQLGKALNDPIKGVTALSKVGVSFSAEQKEMIKTLAESGDVMGAQKIILGELEKQFGGAGEAFAKTTDGKIAHAKNALGNLGETIMGGVLPSLGSLAGKAGTALNSLIENWPTIAAEGKAALKPLMDGFADMEPPLRAFAAWFADNILPHLKTFGMFVLKTVLPALVSLAGFVLSNIVPAFKTMLGWFRDNSKTIGIIAGVILAVLLPSLVQMGIQSAIQGARIVAMWVALNVMGIKALVQQGITVAGMVAGWVLMGWQSLLQAGRMAAAWVVAMGPVGWVIIAIVALVALIIANWDTIVKWTKQAWDWIIGKIVGAWVAIIAKFNWAKAVTIAVFKALWAYVTSAAKGAFDWIVTKAVGFVAFFRGVPGMIRGYLSGMWDGLKSGFKSAINWIIGKWNNLGFDIPKVEILGQTFGGGRMDFPNIPYLAKGGTATSGGAAIVGEAGPELLNLPRGAQVTPLTSGDSLRALGAGGGAGVVVHVHVQGNVTAERDLARSIAGEVQTAIARKDRNNGKR